MTQHKERCEIQHGFSLSFCTPILVSHQEEEQEEKKWE
jgi:hypothetical protein